MSELRATAARLAAVGVVALVALVAAPRRASAQYLDVELGRGGGFAQSFDLGARPFSLDASIPGTGPVHERQLGSAIGLGSYVLGGGGFEMSLAVRRWNVGVAFGGVFGGGGQTSGQIGAYFYGQTLSYSAGFIEPQTVARVRMGGAGDLEFRLGLRVGGLSISTGIVGPTTACPVSCGGASLHYDDAFLMPHVRVDWLGGIYDTRSPMQMEMGLGLDAGVTVYPEVGVMVGASFTVRLPITMG